MAENKNKEILLQWIEEGLNKGNTKIAQSIFANDFVNHLLPKHIPKGYDGQKYLADKLRYAFPDLQITIRKMIAEDNYIAYYGSIKGTHKNDLFKIQAKGKTVEYAFTGIDRFEGGKIIERWELTDMISLLQQAGMLQY